MPIIQGKEPISIVEVPIIGRKLYLGDVTYGKEKISKRVMDEYYSITLEKFRKLLFEENIRTEHDLARSYEEYKVLFEDGHIIRLSNYEVNDFLRFVQTQKKNIEPKENNALRVNANALSKIKDQANIQAM